MHFVTRAHTGCSGRAALPSLALYFLPLSLSFLRHFALVNMPNLTFPISELCSISPLPGRPQGCFLSFAFHFSLVSTVLSSSCLFSLAHHPESGTHMGYCGASSQEQAGFSCPKLCRNPSRAFLSIPGSQPYPLLACPCG